MKGQWESPLALLRVRDFQGDKSSCRVLAERDVVKPPGSITRNYPPVDLQLKAIERTDRGRSRLNAALDIYRQEILPEAQNPERQILYWIDHSRDNLADEFRCFAIQQQNRVVGYLQYSYFREEHLFFFEYLCLRDRRRRGLVPSSGVKAIEDFLGQNYRPGFTLVFEVAKKRDNSGGWTADTKLIRYFARLGFRSIQFDYHYPILQSYEGQQSYPADLMVRLPDGREVVTASEMRTILRSIYFKHYLRWDRPFLDPVRFSERERLINELYSRQIADIGDQDSFGTSGEKNRSTAINFANSQPKISALAERVFGPKLPRLIAVIGVLLITERLLGGGWQLIIFVPAVATIYCLAEDTTASRRLVKVILTRFRLATPRSSPDLRGD